MTGVSSPNTLANDFQHRDLNNNATSVKTDMGVMNITDKLIFRVRSEGCGSLISQEK